MARGYGRTRTNPHEKHMGSYELAAWRDALDMATEFSEEFVVSLDMTIWDAQKLYRSIPFDDRADFDDQNREHIANYVAKTPSQRPAFVKKLLKDSKPETKIVFHLLCIIAAKRAYDLLQLRDRFRMTLAPGLGNRVTASGAYLFCMEASDLISYDWPDDVFEAIGIYSDDDDDDS